MAIDQLCDRSSAGARCDRPLDRNTGLTHLSQAIASYAHNNPLAIGFIPEELLIADRNEAKVMVIAPNFFL